MAAKNPPKTPAAASEKFPIEILLPSYFKNLFSSFTSRRLSYIRAESAPDIKLFPIPSRTSAIRNHQKL